MSFFRVVNVVDGDTFDVTPKWKWNNITGHRIRPTGYDAPEINTTQGQLAKYQLAALIMGKQVKLGSAYKVDRGRLVCDVFYRGRSLADYFKRFR